MSESQTTETIDTLKLSKDYLIELPDIPQVTELELEWIQHPKNQLLQVKLEVGTDLDNLRSFDNQKVLSNVNPAAPNWRFIKNIPKAQEVPAHNALRQYKQFQVKTGYRSLPAEITRWKTLA